MKKPTASIVCASHRQVHPDTMRTFAASGYPHRLIGGISDTALARNLSLSQSIDLDCDVLVMMDDDMVMYAEALHALVQHAHDMQEAVSACYVTAGGRLAAFQIGRGEIWEKCRWVTGLGVLAIPMPRLLQLSLTSEPLRGDGQDVIAFCWSGPGTLPTDQLGEQRRWLSEDYHLTLRFGGAVLAPISAGHAKEIAIWPDKATLERLVRGTLSPEFDREGEQPMRFRDPESPGMLAS